MELHPATHALAVLAADHRAVMRLFADYDELVADGGDAQTRCRLATRICQVLTAHTTAEEELLYPAARRALRDDELIDAALGEHDGMRALIEALEALDASHERCDALVFMLSRAVGAHVRQEEGELFERLAVADLDLELLGEQIGRRRDELLWLLSDGEG